MKINSIKLISGSTSVENGNPVDAECVCTIKASEIHHTKLPETIMAALNQYYALKQVADAARAIYKEMGTRLSPAAFDDLSEEVKTAFHDALSNLRGLDRIPPDVFNDHHRKEKSATRPR